MPKIGRMVRIVGTVKFDPNTFNVILDKPKSIGSRENA